MTKRVEATRSSVAADAPAQPTLLEALPAPDATQRKFWLHRRARAPFEWELRLQVGERTVGLALPRGIPWAQDESREAHPPPAGAEMLPIWDQGTYTLDARDAARTILRFEGRRVVGRYALEVRGGDGDRFALRRLDPISLRPMPERVLPMLAHAASYPRDPSAYAFEIKWDGIRAVAHVDKGRVTLRSRNLANLTSQYPELEPLGDALAEHQAVLDGEIVALDAEGQPSFQRLQGRFGVAARTTARLKAEETPATYMMFDLLYLDGHDVTTRPYEERRALLEALVPEGPSWRVPPARLGDGRALLEDRRWEGIVAKRLGSQYAPGARSRAWIKIKAQRRQEFVIGGWTPGRGGRRGRIGALLLGHYDVTREEAARQGVPQRLRFAGAVGTGFNEVQLRALERLLEADRIDENPFDEEVDRKGATFVTLRHVAEVEFTEWTSEGRLRHPAFKGLRDDKDARDVVREDA